jgi:proteasome lid subunit RPN8/RPN11
MRLTEYMKEVLKSFLEIERQTFSKIVIRQDVIEDIIDFARANAPREFVAVLQGAVKANTLTIDGILYQPFSSSEDNAWMQLALPLLSHAVGSVHSHPSSNTRPSRADLFFFSKHGMVHLIIGAPYTERTIACYDFQGNRRLFTIQG